MGVQTVKSFDNSILYSCRFDQILVGIGGDGKTVWDGNTFGGQVLVHLSQGGIFATDQVYIFNADIIKPENQFFVVRVTHV